MNRSRPLRTVSAIDRHRLCMPLAGGYEQRSTEQWCLVTEGVKRVDAHTLHIPGWGWCMRASAWTRTSAPGAEPSSRGRAVPEHDAVNGT